MLTARVHGLQDLKLARTNSSGAAAQLWPQDEQSIKLILERFDPLQIEWELSSIGGRSDEQVRLRGSSAACMMPSQALALCRVCGAREEFDVAEAALWMVGTDAAALVLQCLT